MTTELEKQFFETFNIPKIFKTIINIGDLDTNYREIQAPTLKELYEEARFDFETPIYFSWFKRSKRWSEEYPQITDKHYLELICALSNYWVETSRQPYLVLLAPNLEELKENILRGCILHKVYKPLYNQVQAIFEGER